jgi:hypothetical protein
MIDQGREGELRSFLPGSQVDALKEADEHCRQQRAVVERVVNAALDERRFDRGEVCVVVVGSVGRMEALPGGGPDVDLVPILVDEAARQGFCGGEPSLDRIIRDRVEEALAVKVSNGDELTAAMALPDLSNVETIGTSTDTSARLTRRVLILTEGQRAGGDLAMDAIRQGVLRGYSGAARTRGRHVLSFCNDVARYYRTLCVEYKGRVDAGQRAWATRNMKLRHSRKVWYFATMLMMASLSLEAVEEHDVERAFLEKVQQPPLFRLLDALPNQLHPACREFFERFVWFLRFMASPKNRGRLDKVAHEGRHELTEDNPFPALKLNSDVLHREMLHILDSLDPPRRRRVLNWFLL